MPAWIISASPYTYTPGCALNSIVRPESVTNASCVETMPAMRDPTSTTSSFMGVERFSRRESFSSASTRRLRRCTSEFTVSRRSVSALNTPSTMASTVDWMAMSGVRSSCATIGGQAALELAVLLNRLGHGIERFAETGYLVVAVHGSCAPTYRLP